MGPATPYVPLIVGTALSLYGQKRSADASRNAQRQAYELEQQRIQQYNEHLAAEIAARRQQEQIQLAANASQSQLADQRTQELINQVQTGLGQSEIPGLKKAEAKKLGDVVDKNIAVAGGGSGGGPRKVGSNIKGNVSESFNERGQGAAATNEARARRLADQLAVIDAFKQQPAVRGAKVADVGLSLLPYQRQSEALAGITASKLQAAGIVPPIPAEGYSLIDPNNTRAQILTGLGNGIMSYPVGPYSQPAGAEQIALHHYPNTYAGS